MPGLRNEVRGAVLMESGEQVEVTRDDEGLVLSLPTAAPDPVVSIVRLDVAGALDVDPITLRQGPDGRIVLDVLYAELSNPGYGQQAQVEEQGGRLNIGYWLDARSWAQWTFQVTRPGTFVVTTEVAAPAKSALRWGVDGELRPATLEPTGSYDVFRRIELGRVTIDAAGRHVLAVHPVAEAWQAINLRALELTPQ